MIKFKKKEFSNPYDDIPKVTELEDGIYEGTISGHIFKFDNKKYYSELGVRSPFPVPYTIIIKDGKHLEAERLMSS